MNRIEEGSSEGREGEQLHAHTRIRGALRSDRRIVTLSLRRGCGSTTEKSTWANSSLCVFKLFDINISLLSNLALRFSARMMSSLRLLLAGAGCSPDKLRRLDLPESIIYQISGCHVTIRGYLLSRIYETGRYMRRWHLILVLSYMVWLSRVCIHPAPLQRIPASRRLEEDETSLVSILPDMCC